ncbi:glycoside hydrolase family 3 C-terminal domain-containing protein [Paractinoplanes atraurantiacus]|uniref:Exo-alpha-(1->6)-L-arabinopyranosidase n=1 Tax=Paractinoplanes atraurantiacus TaxID=1036182 RepID=A0A285K342_9ACTN|nr:glycoside hydrolase family 3 C-terminal domain-containing protein [Actinoplanes atraurantiacus]SNY66447.1 beta-glucosidase [Actinoplanes atraurantiacus]
MELTDQAALTSGSAFWTSTEAGGVPQITLTDGPHGVRMQSSEEDMLTGRPATAFPPAVTSGSTWDPALVRRMGEALGDECRAMGVQVLLGPGINIKRTPLGGRNFEYFSEDPLISGVMATEWVLGLQSRGVGASLKHFAVNSQETDRMTISADVDERTLREIYLRAFQRVVTRSQPWTVMCSYNRVNGVHASQNRWLLTDVLRGEWGFEGLVVSDWGAVVDRVAAVHAGLDLTMPGPDEAGDAALVAAVKDGSLAAGDLRLSADRVAALVAKSRLETTESYDADAHHALAREIAARGIVLLKNDGDVLPLRAEGQSIAVLGEYARTPRFQGGGSSQITPTRLDDALTEITASSSAAVTFAPGYSADENAVVEPLLDEAAAAAAGADVALVFVGSKQETEGSDRDGIDLPASHRALVERVAAANPRTVVVLSNGAVVRTAPWDEAVPGIVEAWLLGQAGGSAIADVLFGRVNPSGRLTETIPLKLADHPSFLDFPGEAGHVRYGEGLHVGYRGFDAREQEVAYPFGFGLSYTTFEYGMPSATVTASGVELTIDVTNTGARDGREVVQAYMEVTRSRVRRAPRELKAFANVAIAAGATETVTLQIPRDDLAYWDERLSRWVVEGGEYHFAVGASSRDLRGAVLATIEADAGTRWPLTADSTIAEWFADPRGADLLRKAFADAAGTGTGIAAQAADPAMLQLLGGLPLNRLGMFPGSPFTEETVQALAAAAND